MKKEEKRAYRFHRKISGWDCQFDKNSEIAVIERYLQFRFYKQMGTLKMYDEAAYRPLWFEIKRAINDDKKTIVVIEKGHLSIYINGKDKVQGIIESVNKIIDKYEEKYGRDYPTIRSREYKSKKENQDLM